MNDAPVAEDDSATTDEDTPANINVITNDTDVDNTNAELSVSSFTQPSNGTVTKNADGTLRYNPAADFNGTDSFTYEVCDGGDPALCGTATVTMTVSPVPDACTIKGTGKDDVLRGTAHRDVICARGGNDTVYGRGGVGNETPFTATPATTRSRGVTGAVNSTATAAMTGSTAVPVRTC